jgi:hypothetical protein
MNVIGAFLSGLGHDPLSNALNSESPVHVHFARLGEGRCSVCEQRLSG